VATVRMADDDIPDLVRALTAAVVAEPHPAAATG
jgi:hypothetical protein